MCNFKVLGNYARLYSHSAASRSLDQTWSNVRPQKAICQWHTLRLHVLDITTERKRKRQDHTFQYVDEKLTTDTIDIYIRYACRSGEGVVVSPLESYMQATKDSEDCPRDVFDMEHYLVIMSKSVCKYIFYIHIM